MYHEFIWLCTKMNKSLICGGIVPNILQLAYNTVNFRIQELWEQKWVNVSFLCFDSKKTYLKWENLGSYLTFSFNEFESLMWLKFLKNSYLNPMDTRFSCVQQEQGKYWSHKCVVSIQWVDIFYMIAYHRHICTDSLGYHFRNKELNRIHQYI